MLLADTHSHIIPHVDDGAKDEAEAIKLLESEKKQGVSHVILTPHFYADYSSFEEHMARIKHYYHKLLTETEGKDLPKLILGHEVRYYGGISNTDVLDAMCIGKTNYILVELPMGVCITNTMLNELLSLKYDCGYNVILAHIERYCKEKLFNSIIEMAANDEVKLQISSSFLSYRPERHCVNKLCKNHLISYIGSDAHSVKERPVIISDIYEYIKKENYVQYRKCLRETEELIEEIENAE